MPAMSTANLRGEMIEGLNYAGLNESGWKEVETNISYHRNGLFNSREAIVAIIRDIAVFYNSKNMNCIEELSFF